MSYVFKPNFKNSPRPGMKWSEHHKNRAPALSLDEVAAKLGVSRISLSLYMRREGSPKPCFVTNSSLDKGLNKRYHLEDFLKWWPTIQKEPS